MGSGCSILNDTEYNVWIYHGNRWSEFNAIISDAISIVPAVLNNIGLVNETTPTADSSADSPVHIVASNAEKLSAIDNIEGFTRMYIVTTFDVTQLSQVMGLKESEAENLQKRISDLRDRAEEIKPNEEYTWNSRKGPVKTKTVYVMNEKLQHQQRCCSTSGHLGKVRNYRISEHFKNLDVKAPGT